MRKTKSKASFDEHTPSTPSSLLSHHTRQKGLSLLLASVSSFVATEGLNAATEPNENITEIIVSSDKEEDQTKISPGTAALMKTPGNFGDPLQALISLPGITFGGGDLDQPVVRGSGPGDNLYIIDDMQVGYLFHKLSDSVISKNVVHSFDLKAAAYGAEYGDVSGGVIDVALRDPNGESYSGNFDVGMLKSGFLLEGGISDNTSFYIAGRYNTAHWFMTQFEESGDGTTYNMPKSHDYTARIKWQGADSSLTFTAIGAKDIEEDTQDEGVISDIPLGSKTVESFSTFGLRYEKSFENGGIFATTLSRTGTKIRDDFEGTRFTDLKKAGYYARSHYTQSFGDHDVKLGLNFNTVKATYSYDTVQGFCNNFDSWCLYTPFEQGTRKETLNQTELYIRDNYNASETVRIELGAQVAKDHFLKQTFIEPRVGIYWDASDKSQFYARYGRYHKRPSMEEILAINVTQRDQRNEISSHMLAGHRWQVAEGWIIKTEAYYKDIYTQFYPKTPFYRQIDGTAYGAEFLLAKQAMEEGLYGWVALSFGKSNRTDRATGEKVDYRYSTPFSGTFAVSYNFGKGWNLGTKLRLQSGDTYTPVDSIRRRADGDGSGPRSDGEIDNIANRYIYDFGEPNSKRTPMYQRLDVRLEKQSEYSFGDITYYIDIVNVLNKENLSNRDFPARLITPDGAGGFVANPETDTNIPFFIGAGINLAF